MSFSIAPPSDATSIEETVNVFKGNIIGDMIKEAPKRAEYR